MSLFRNEIKTSNEFVEREQLCVLERKLQFTPKYEIYEKLSRLTPLWKGFCARFENWYGKSQLLLCIQLQVKAEKTKSSTDKFDIYALGGFYKIWAWNVLIVLKLEGCFSRQTFKML